MTRLCGRSPTAPASSTTSRRPPHSPRCSARTCRPACSLSDTPMSAPAGWYDDGSGRQRWWDGSQWTENYYVAQADAVTSAQPQVIDTSSAAEVAPVAAPAPFVPPYVIAAKTTAPVQHPSAAPVPPGYAQPYPMAAPKPGFPVLGVIGLSVVGL